ncbi:MAG: sigma-54-dependent Fis family transcriptional regulator [Marinilabiliales bacterium]|nr:MAG: sigma-54-dependent Fis family transcriptional regulator [Marinilabiliales bacterium]
MKTNARILIVDDEKDILLAAKMFLRNHFTDIHTEANPERIPEIIQEHDFDVILLDMNFKPGATTGQEGFHWLDVILKHDPAAVVIFITGYGDIDLAIQGIKQGATNFILKPWDNEKLITEIINNLEVRNTKQEMETCRAQKQLLIDENNDEVNRLIGKSDRMIEVINLIRKVAATDANVLVLGENGTGKELVARAVHALSSRKDEIFVPVDLGAISESLFESELFGYVKGAFTDARQDRAGRFEAAKKGTIFLDEIGNLSLQLQSKLLTVLQSRKVVRLGSNKETPIDVRLICATNMPLYEMVEENKFRQDLMYRINTVEIHVPPLRERQEDIPELANHFIEQYCRKYRLEKKRVSQATLNRLKAHDWPGNVRELQHAVERAIILSEDIIMDAAAFFPGGSAKTKKKTENGNLHDQEKNLIREALDNNNGNITKAAKELGLTRASLYRRIEKYGL